MEGIDCLFCWVRFCCVGCLLFEVDVDGVCCDGGEEVCVLCVEFLLLEDFLELVFGVVVDVELDVVYGCVVVEFVEYFVYCF